MKKIVVVIILLLASVSSFSQIKDSVKSDALHFKSIFKAQLIYPIQFGNNALAKAHRPNIGFGFQYNFLNYNKFHFGIGTDFIRYVITDKAVVANLKSSQYSSLYFLLNYEFNPTNKLRLIPNVGYGNASLDLGKMNSRFGGQNGNEIRVGIQSDCKIGKATYTSFGLSYIRAKYDIRTVPEYIDYFRKSDQLQLSLGIRIGN